MKDWNWALLLFLLPVWAACADVPHTARVLDAQIYTDAAGVVEYRVWLFCDYPSGCSIRVHEFRGSSSHMREFWGYAKTKIDAEGENIPIWRDETGRHFFKFNYIKATYIPPIYEFDP